MLIIRKITVALLLIAAGTAGNAAADAPQWKIHASGVLEAAGIRFAPAFLDSRWKFHGVNTPAFRQKQFNRSGSHSVLKAEVALPNSQSGRFQQVCDFSDTGVLTYRGIFEFSAKPDAREFALAAIGLTENRFGGREVIVDGRTVTFPRLPRERKTAIFFREQAETIEFPLENGVLAIRGKFRLLLQDDRPLGGSGYAMRLAFTPAANASGRLTCELEWELRPYRNRTLDLSGAANTAFADSVADDRRGGWTDQGAECDLSMLSPGIRDLKGTQFQILDPAANGGKSCIVLAGRNRPYFARSAAAPQPHPVCGNFLYLLHAVAWPPSSANAVIGTVELIYRDRTSRRILVTSADVGDWRNPAARPNGDIVWSSESRGVPIGLYRSRFPIDPGDIVEIRFESAQASVWGIIAASVSPDVVYRTLSTPFIVAVNSRYRPLPLPREIVKGSIFDSSGLLDAPAGKYGCPVIRNGKIEFENRPGKPVRFFGVNLSRQTQFQDKAAAEKLADELAAHGYNAVRIHHHDTYMVSRENGKSTELSAEQMDKLDYLIYCLKQRGIYILSDLYVSRELEAGEIPEFPGKKLWQENFKPLLFVLDSVLENWKNFSLNWLNHVNPYTGYALKDEPALISLSLVNESSLTRYYNRMPEVEAIYLRKFEEWKKRHGRQSAKTVADDPLFAQFLQEIYGARYAEMKQFLRDNGVERMFSDQNFLSSPLLTAMRSQYDFVENHFYWDHPSFQGGWWKFPAKHHNLSSIRHHGAAPGVLFSSRIYGKPFMVTEFDYAGPNMHRAEGGVLTGGYAALQDWDGLFQYAHLTVKTDLGKTRGFHFDSTLDPMKELSLRIARALFCEGGVEPAKQKFVIVRRSQERFTLRDADCAQINRLGLMAQVGNAFLDDGATLPGGSAAAIELTPGTGAECSLPCFRAGEKLLDEILRAKLLRPGQYRKSEFYQDQAGQLTLAPEKGIVRAVSPACCALILPPGNRDKAGILQVDNRIGRAVFAAIAADGRQLTESERILILHLTDALPDGTRFGDGNRVTLDAWGRLPMLAACGEAQISLTLPPGKDTRLFAVDLSGRRMAEIPVQQQENGMVSFPAKVFMPSGEVAFAYELICN